MEKLRLVKVGRAEMRASLAFTMSSAERTIYLLSRYVILFQLLNESSFAPVHELILTLNKTTLPFPAA